eukprot:gene3114-3947_t
MRQTSNQAGSLADDPSSATFIARFIDTFDIDMTEVLGSVESFNTFNEFFTRKLKPGARPIYQPSNLRHASFEGGGLAICRLTPQDYHHVHSPVKGRIVSISPIMGKQYWSVNPVAVNSAVPVFTENIRQVIIIHTKEFGKVAIVLIGATMVGSIIIHDNVQEGLDVNKGDDLGMYKLGGSTTIIVFQKKRIKFDADLLKNKSRRLETFVKMGDALGRARS